MRNKHPHSFRYYIVHKPYNVLCQFTKEGDGLCLGDLYSFPKDVYPVGRLDKDSEGLLILTNDTSLNALLLQPDQKIWKTYWVQVEGSPSEKDISRFSQQISIRVKGKVHQTLPARASYVDPHSKIQERNPPIRYRKHIPTTWLSIQLREGKNRQVRKMTAAIGFPTLRLIRMKIGAISLNHLLPGEYKTLTRQTIYKLLNRAH